MWVKMTDDNSAFRRKRATREYFVVRDSDEKDFAIRLPFAVINAPYLAV